MANVEYIPGLAQVFDSWSGNVAVTIGATTVTVTPTKGSCASVWVELVEQCRLTHGGNWNGWVDSDKHVVIQHSSSFTITASGSTQTRLNLSASYSGVRARGVGPHVGGFYPLGFGFTGFDRMESDGAAAADGSGATPLIWKSNKATATFLDTWANIYDWHDDLVPSGDILEVDVWMGGREFGRYVVDDARTNRLSSVVDYVELGVELSGVAS